MKVISAAEVTELLTIPECIELMSAAMAAASAGDVRVPARLMMPTTDDHALLALMPGSSRSPAVYGAKIISIHDDNPQKGLPAIQGFICLFDQASGKPLALIEGASITAIRTAAASGLATKLLANENASSHGIFGAGVQAVTHLDAISAVRPSEKVIVWNRNHSRAVQFANTESKRTGLNIAATLNPADAAGCDIITTVTASTTPVLLSRWVSPGTHINLVGAHSPVARETDSELMLRASIYTDLLESLLNESGDFLLPIGEGLFDRGHARGEIGNVVRGTLAGRRDEKEITVYKSLGIVAQDLFAAWAIYQKAVTGNLGTNIELT